MNKHDSERIAGLLTSEGYEQTGDMEQASVIIFNTCCVRKHADDRLYGNVASLKQLKIDYPEKILAVGGCLAQKDGEKMQIELPHVDIVFGTRNHAKLPRLIKEARQKKQICDVSEDDTDFISNLPDLKVHTHHSWLPITVGCDNFCSYCIVPYVRGAERSRSREDILGEANRLAAAGVIEITLLGQNVNSYGRDLYGEPQFDSLLIDVSKIAELKRIRFTTSHPKDLSDEVIGVVASGDNICPHFHLPVQSGSNSILKAMKRLYTREKYLELTAKIRDKVPDVALTTDIMVGFPGETEADFEDTLELVRLAEFDQAFTFKYSKRPGTAAAELTDQVPEPIKSERFQRLIDLQNAVCLSKNTRLKGRTFEVFVEGLSRKGKNNLKGRTGSNKLVHFKGSERIISTFTNVKIIDAYSWFLIGEAET